MRGNVVAIGVIRTYCLVSHSVTEKVLQGCTETHLLVEMSCIMKEINA